MFNTIRKNQKGLMIALAILVIIAFAWLYNPADMRELGANVAAKVYGSTVTTADVERQARLYPLAMAMGQLDLLEGLGALSGNENQDINQFIWNSLVLRHEAAALGLEPTMEQVAERTRNLPAFQTNGRFDPQKFERFTAENLGPQGMTGLQLEEVMKDTIRLEMLKGVVTSTAAVPSSEVDRALRIFEPIQMAVFQFPVEPVAAGITISEEDAKSYYEKNKGLFVAPESLALEYVKFSLPEEKKSLEAKERVAALQEVATLASDFAGKAAGDFSAAAAAGNLEVAKAGPFDRRNATSVTGIPAAVAQGAFLLPPDQPVSDVTQAGDDFFVYRIAAREPERELGFEEARPSAEARLRAMEASRLLQEQAAVAIAKIRESLQSGKTAEEAALAAGVKVEVFANVNPSAPEVPPQFFNLVRVSALLEPGQVSNLLNTAEGGAAVAVLTRATEPAGAQVPTGEEIRSQLLEGKRDLFFAVWLDERTKAALVFPQRRQ